MRRRRMLALTSRAVLGGSFGPSLLRGFAKDRTASLGIVSGHRHEVAAGSEMLAAGGNAVDAAVAAALVSCVATPDRCGIGGYGGHMTIAPAKSGNIVSIDFNSTAPADARPDMFELDSSGRVKGLANVHGWLAAGVPGTLAGLGLALRKYGTRTLDQVLQPAISCLQEGIVVEARLAATLQNSTAFRADSGSARIYYPGSKPLRAGDRLRNPDLLELLQTLAKRKSVESFYRGDIAQRIAEGFQKNGGLVTVGDLGDYQAAEIEPLRLGLSGCTIYTGPLTAGGLTVLEALQTLGALHWADMKGPGATHAWLEALRVAWRDRLALLGDPATVKVPVEKLLSNSYAAEAAKKILTAVEEKKPVVTPVETNSDDGTTHISATDAAGNWIALTLTHGGSFGAQVTIEGLGLTLGHGMSRFNPHAGHPNCPGPGKRPLHNMCPTIVCRGGKPVLAVGGAGGVKIPSSLYHFLSAFVLQSRPMREAMETPRLHCEGTLNVTREPTWPGAETAYLEQLGFATQTGAAARLTAVGLDTSGELIAAAR